MKAFEVIEVIGEDVLERGRMMGKYIRISVWGVLLVTLVKV